MRYLLFAICFSFLSFGVAQKQNNYWLLQNSAMVNFNVNPPKADYGAYTNVDLNHISENSTVSDANGNLLFYTNGKNVWGKDRQFLKGGSLLDTNTYRSLTGCVIVPKPKHPNVYYIFYTYGFNGHNLYYATVDMRANNGKGEVVEKNIPLWGAVFFGIKATGVDACNGIWVIAQDASRDQFISFRIGASKIDTVISIHANLQFGGYNSYFEQNMRLSADASLIAMTNRNTFSTFELQKCYLYQFDNKTGLIDREKIIIDEPWPSQSLEFSPNGKKLYINTTAPYLNDDSKLWNVMCEYDVSIFDSKRVNGSMKKHYFNRSTSFPSGYSMMVAPNGKLYTARGSQDNKEFPNIKTYLGEFLNANEGGMPKINQESIYITTKYDNVGKNDGSFFLNANYLQNYYEHLPKLVLPNKFCTGDSINLRADTAYASTIYKWFVNDSLVSTAAQPKIKLDKVGKQNITLHINECLVEQDIQVSPSLVPILKDTSLCEAQPISLTAANNGNKYLWNTKETTQTIAVSNGGKYKVTVTNTCNQILDSASVKLYPRFYDFLNPITEVCEQGKVTLTAPSGATNYNWNTGETTSSITITQAGKYQVQLANRCYALSDSTEVVFFNEIYKTSAQNLVTANGDGKNEALELFTHDLQDFTLSIYNRWGARVFISHNSLEVWKPNEVEAGVYYYSVTAAYCNGKPYEQKGWVQVVK